MTSATATREVAETSGQRPSSAGDAMKPLGDDHRV
jgi:hypothetical protein